MPVRYVPKSMKIPLASGSITSDTPFEGRTKTTLSHHSQRRSAHQQRPRQCRHPRPSRATWCVCRPCASPTRWPRRPSARHRRASFGSSGRRASSRHRQTRWCGRAQGQWRELWRHRAVAGKPVPEAKLLELVHRLDRETSESAGAKKRSALTHLQRPVSRAGKRARLTWRWSRANGRPATRSLTCPAQIPAGRR